MWRNWRILHTQMKGRCWCSITVNLPVPAITRKSKIQYSTIQFKQERRWLLFLSHTIQVESGALTHFECGDAAFFPVRNWRILHTQMKHRCWCSILFNFRGDQFSSVSENQMQIWSTNFGVSPVTSHWLLPGMYNIPSAIRLHRTSPKQDQGDLREDLAVEYGRCYSLLVT